MGNIKGRKEHKGGVGYALELKKNKVLRRNKGLICKRKYELEWLFIRYKRLNNEKGLREKRRIKYKWTSDIGINVWNNAGLQ